MGVSYQLYELSGRYQALMDRIEEQEGELSEQDEQELTIAEEDLAEAISESYKALKNLKCTITGLKEEKDILTARIRKYEKMTERIQDSVKRALIAFGKDQGKTYGNDQHYAYITYTHPVEANEDFLIEKIAGDLDEFVAKIPDYYKVSVSINKSAIGKRIDAGEKIEGASKGNNANVFIK